MWEPRRLTTLWVSTPWYKDSFILFSTGAVFLAVRPIFSILKPRIFCQCLLPYPKNLVLRRRTLASRRTLCALTAEWTQSYQLGGCELGFADRACIAGGAFTRVFTRHTYVCQCSILGPMLPFGPKFLVIQ
jgi:hypothetical protein